MATKRPELAKPSAARGVLATNVAVHGAGPDGETVWYGPSYPENGEPPAEAAERMASSVWSVPANWTTKDDAERVGLVWEDRPAATAQTTGGEG